MKTRAVSKATLERRFIATLKDVKLSIVKCANAYKACIDGGVDMSKYGYKFGERLMQIAEGRLLPEAHTRLYGNEALMDGLAALPVTKQKELLRDGAPVVRGGEVVTLPLERLSAPEARRLIDTAGGTGRILPPEEQAARIATPVVSRDKIVELRFSPEEYAVIAKAAKKVGHTVQYVARKQLLASELFAKTPARATQKAKSRELEDA